jgi:hypothetical protein
MAARLIGVSALAIVPPFVTDGVVIVDQVTDADIVTMKAKLTEAGEQFRSIAAGRNGDRPLIFRPKR